MKTTGRKRDEQFRNSIINSMLRKLTFFVSYGVERLINDALLNCL